MSALIEDIKSGWLNKKSPNGLPGFRVWQRRWFVLRREPIAASKTAGGGKAKGRRTMLHYFKDDQGGDPIGSIPIKTIVSVSLLPAKRKGCRFDIKVDNNNNRVYALDGSSPQESKEWVAALQSAIASRNRRSTVTAPTGIITSHWTKLQDTFFKLKFLQQDAMDHKPASVSEGGKSEISADRESVSIMNNQFNSDAKVLAYILKNVIYTRPIFSYKRPSNNAAFGSAAAAAAGLAGGSGNYNGMNTDGTMEIGGGGVNVNGEGEGGEGEIEEDDSTSIYLTSGEEEDHIRKLRSENNEKLYRGIHSTEFIRNLLHVFGKQDSVAHALALRFLWMVLHENCIRFRNPLREAIETFKDNCSIFVSGHAFNSDIRNALFSLLFHDNRQVVREIDTPVAVGMRRSFIQYGVLAPLFLTLRGSDWQIRSAVLEDINTALIGSPENCAKLRAITTLNKKDTWEHFLLHLLTDIPLSALDTPAERDPLSSSSSSSSSSSRSKPDPKKFSTLQRPISLRQIREGEIVGEGESEGDPNKELLSKTTQIDQKKCYALTLNIFAVMHFQIFSDSYRFSDLFCASLEHLFVFSGPADRTAAIGHVFFQSIINKLASRDLRRLFPPDGFTSSVTYFNLDAFITFLKIFVFQCANWRTPSVNKAVDEHRRTTSMINVKLLLNESGNNAKFVLDQSRIKDAAFLFRHSDQYGIHFDQNGNCADVPLIKSLMAVMQSLHLDKVDIDSNPNIPPADAAFLKRMANEYAFLNDAVSLLQWLHRSQIDEQKISWRYISLQTQKFLEADSSRIRSLLIDDVRDVIRGAKSLNVSTVRRNNGHVSMNSIMNVFNSAFAQSPSPSAQNRSINQNGLPPPPPPPPSSSSGAVMHVSPRSSHRSIVGGVEGEGVAEGEGEGEGVVGGEGEGEGGEGEGRNGGEEAEIETGSEEYYRQQR